MFGKGGGALSTWIKEFCELVFIQTLQAFIYAIVIGFICTVLTDNAGLSPEDNNASVGIICVIALTAIFKVEDLARKIFGFGPTKADHGNAIASLAKTGFALKMGKNVLDNGKKLLTGAGAVARAPMQKLKAKNDMQSEKEAYLKDNNMLGGESASPSVATSQKNNNSGKRAQLQEEAAKYRKLGEQATDSSSSSSTSPGNTGLPKDYYQKMRQFESNYKKEIKEINKNRREGIKNIARGVLESGGAVVGFTTGAIIGGADGNLGEAIQGGLTGMGAGDMIGKGMVDVPAGVIEYGEDVAKEIKGALRKSSRSSVSTPKVSAPKSTTTRVTAPKSTDLHKAIDNYAETRAAQNDEILEEYSKDVSKQFDNAGKQLDDIAKSADADLQSGIQDIDTVVKRGTRGLSRDLQKSTRRNVSGGLRQHRGGMGSSNVGLRTHKSVINQVDNARRMTESKASANNTKVNHDASDFT